MMKTDEIVKLLQKGTCKFSNIDNLAKHGFIEYIEFHLKNVKSDDFGCSFYAELERQIPVKILKKYNLSLVKNKIILIGYSSALRAIMDKK